MIHRFVNKGITHKLPTALVAVFVFGMFLSKQAQAQFLLLEPQTLTKNVGETFTVDLKINTEGKAVAGTDVKINFDPEMLEVTGVTTGDFFSDSAKNIGSNSLYIAGFFRAQYETKTGAGKVASLTLKGKKTGTTPLTFVCSLKTNDTNILDGSAADIINCASTPNGSYTFGTVAGPTSTPAPGPTNTPAPSNPTATPTVPVTGSGTTTMALLVMGVVIIFGGAALAF